MADTGRARKLAERIQQVVAQMIDTRVKDPRLGFVTVTDVRVTGDLQHADVYYTVLGDDEARAGSAKALESAKGLIRSEVGKQTGIRLTPTLAFHLDAVPETAAHLEEALSEAARRDAEVARHVSDPFGPMSPHDASGGLGNSRVRTPRRTFELRRQERLSPRAPLIVRRRLVEARFELTHGWSHAKGIQPEVPVG